MQESTSFPIGFVIAIGLIAAGLVRSRKRRRTTLCIVIAMLTTIVAGMVLVLFNRTLNARVLGQVWIDVVLFSGALVALLHSRRTRKNMGALSKPAH